MKKEAPKRGTLVPVEIEGYSPTRRFEVWYYGHRLTPQEIFHPPADGSYAWEKSFRDIDDGKLSESDFEYIIYEEWWRWGICTCGDDHNRDIYEAEPHARGAFPVTRINFKQKDS